jgi:protein ImuA
LFVAGILARQQRPVLWCSEKRDLFAPGLASAGLHPENVIYAEATRANDVLLLMEEGLRHASLGGVVGEVGRMSLTASRRLQRCSCSIYIALRSTNVLLTTNLLRA